MASPSGLPKFSFTRPNPNKEHNREPRETEIGLLDQLVRGKRRYLSALDEEIADTTAAATRLREEIVDMEFRMDEKRSMLALLNQAIDASHENRQKVLRDIMNLSNVIPVSRRLPDEVLLRIFIYAVDMEEAERRTLASEWRSYSLGRAPLTINTVCRRWRNIARGTPSLWRYINLVSQDHDTPTVHPVLDMWCGLGHSTQREISIDGWKQEHYTLLPTLVLPKSDGHSRPILPRIEVSYIDGSTDFNSDWPSFYPLAHEVVLISNGVQGICSFFIPLAARAERLVLYGIKPWWTEAVWDSLTHLTISGVPSTRLPALRGADIVELLTMVPGLQKLDIDWSMEHSERGEGPEARAPMLEHPSLRHISCSFEAIDTFLFPLQGIVVCAALQILEFKTLPFITPPLHRGWMTLLEVIPSGSLTTVHVPKVQLDAIPHLLKLFERAPSISSLHLTGRAVDELLRKLVVDTESASTPVILPNISHLVLKYANVTDATLTRLVESRKRPSTSSRSYCRIESILTCECASIRSADWETIRLSPPVLE